MTASWTGRVISFHFQPVSGSVAEAMTGPSGEPFLTSNTPSWLPVKMLSVRFFGASGKLK